MFKIISIVSKPPTKEEEFYVSPERGANWGKPIAVVPKKLVCGKGSGKENCKQRKGVGCSERP